MCSYSLKNSVSNKFGKYHEFFLSREKFFFNLFQRNLKASSYENFQSQDGTN